MLNIVTVCGMGVGTSLIMKMTVDDALKETGVDYKVEHWDMGTVKGKNPDLIVTTTEFEKKFKDLDNVVYLENIMDKEEAKNKLTEYFEENGIS